MNPGSSPTSHAGAGLRHPRWALFLAGCLATLLPVLQPHLQAQTPGRFDAEIAAFERSDRLSPPPPRPFLFTGSSSIRMWTGLAAAFPGQPVLNRGFGGSEMSDLLHYYERVIRPYNPSLLFVYEGDNDLSSGLTPAAVAAAYSDLIARLRQDLPDTHTVFLAVKPSPSRIGLLDAQRDLNARLRALADAEPSVSFVDVFSPMLDATGTPRPELYLSDRLHMTAAGYEVWRFVIQGFLDSRATRPRRTILIDFGATATPTRLQAAPDDPLRTWNNLPTTLGTTTGSILSPLLTTLGAVTPFALHVDQRFNAANSSGTTLNKSYPARATLDSLFGNTEEFGGLANIQPVLRLSGLLQLDWQDPPRRARLTFQAPALSSPTSVTLLVSNLSQTAHRLESSPDLLSWSLEQSLPAGPSDATVTVAIPTNSPSRFFRVFP